MRRSRPTLNTYAHALVLIAAAIVAFAFLGDEGWPRLVSIAVESLALLAILEASAVPRPIIGLFLAVAVLALAGATVAVAAGDDGGIGAAIVGACLALGGPAAILWHVRDHDQIDLTTVGGALCIYLLGGLFFAYVFAIVGWFDEPFFAQVDEPEAVDFVYFSFVTLTTTGYGDLTARSDLGRMVAVSEALMGQLYLVTAVALLVANVGQPRVRGQLARRLADDAGASPTEPRDDDEPTG